jgi:hypothetical protein
MLNNDLPPIDAFDTGIPECFDERARDLWDNAECFCQANGFRSVPPWTMFAAWLAKDGIATLPFSSDILVDAARRIVRGGVPSQDGPALHSDRNLREVFALALSDSVRFSGQGNHVDSRWIVPNLLVNRFVADVVAGRLAQNYRSIVRAVVNAQGYPFPFLFGHYIFRIGAFLGTDLVKDSNPCFDG